MKSGFENFGWIFRLDRVRPPVLSERDAGRIGELSTVARALERERVQRDSTQSF